ncbi:heparinase II/III family protein, partial [Candidatus Sumerlaeota bacterium]|nr:heparinase II/III family protein [Candidatus Sumerlaeota bacterium]
MQRLVAFLFFIFSAAHLAFPARTIAGAANQIQRPPSATSLNLFFTDRLLERMKTRIEQQRWARQIWETRLETARRWVALKMEIPKTGGGYFHDYACPDDGARLEFNPARPRQHLCPTCKRLLTGPQLDAYWVSIVHASNIQTAKALALNARLFGNEADAKWAKDILQYYARHYEEYPVHGNRAGQGRIFFQSLDESVNMLEAAAVFELLLPSELSADEADVVREKLFRPAGALVRKFHRGVHNIQCWHAAFLLTCAIICDDKPLRDEALASVEANLIKGVTPDGWWWEGSPGYHFYTLSALNRLAIPARHNQLTTEHTSRMIEMLMVPFRVAYPDLNLPAVNDTHIPRLASLAPYLEAGIYLFDDQRLGAALSQLYESGKVERSSFEALCYGPDKLARGDQLVQKSERLDHAGMAILRRPRSGLYALLRSGIYQGGHDHPDRLGLIVYGLGQQLAPDLGTCGYGLPLLRWYRSTVAHNTLVIDEHSLDVRKSDATCT